MVRTEEALVLRSEWSGALSRQDDPPHVNSDLVIDPPGASWSAPLKVAADDGSVYWVKTQQCCPAGGSSLAIEQVLGRLAKMLDISVVTPPLVYLPSELGVTIRGVQLVSGYAHGTLAIGSCFELRQAPDFRDQDDNGRRHTGLYALYDWACGSDPQFLYDQDDDNATYSHDHGLYLCGDGHIDPSRLASRVSADHPALGPATGLSQSAIDDYADRLEAVSRDDVVSVLNWVPTSWPVSDDQLETLGWFLVERAPLTASHLRQLNSR
jgi:hypothetical protein